MSYKENSILASLLITLIIWGNYALEIISLNQHQLLSIDTINSLLASAMIYTILFEIVSQSTVAIFKHKEANEKDDERDKHIAMRSNSYAYHILLIGVVFTVFYIAQPNWASLVFSSPVLTKEYEIINLVIIFAVASEVTRLSAKFLAYRRGF